MELATPAIGSRGAVVVRRLEGEVDLSNASVLQERILRSLAGPRALILDLPGVTYLDSAGLALLSRVQVACRRLRIQIACIVGERSMAGRTLEPAGFELAGMRLSHSIDEAERLVAGTGAG